MLTKKWLKIGFGVVVFCLLSLEIWIRTASLGSLAFESSKIVRDRNGDILTAYTTSDGYWRLPCKIGEVDPSYIDALIAFEDKRFWDHGGVDFLAAGRAFGSMIANARVDSGASTLTMQTVRLVNDLPTGSLLAKFQQMRLAWAIERQLSKEEILNLYLQNAPFGGNLEGACSASYAFFQKEPHQLSTAQTALLIAIPQSPRARRPDRNYDNSIKARGRVIDRLEELGVIEPTEARIARTDFAPKIARPFPRLALHLSDQMKTQDKLAIDRELQARLEQFFRASIHNLGPDLSGALLVLDQKTGDVLSYIGSPEYTDSSRMGYIDMAQAWRSPGSTLKPLIYGKAFSEGILHPDTIINDVPRAFGDYRPSNFDGRYLGAMSVAEALRASRNVPAISVLDRLGVEQFENFLERAGTKPKILDRDNTGLAIGLGGVGMKPIELINLYVAIANGGYAVGPRIHMSNDAVSVPRILNQNSANMLTDILRQAKPPGGRQAGLVAFKTGTSYGNRDAWTIAYDDAHVVLVHIGRADNQSVLGLSGYGNAAPIAFGAFDIVGVAPLERANIEMAQTEEVADHLRYFDGDLNAESKFSFMFPPEGARMESCDHVIPYALSGGVAPFDILMNEALMQANEFTRDGLLKHNGGGFYDVLAIDEKGRTAKVRIEITDRNCG